VTVVICDGLVVVTVPPTATGVTVEAVSEDAAAGKVILPSVDVPSDVGAVVCEPTKSVMSSSVAPWLVPTIDGVQILHTSVFVPAAALLVPFRTKMFDAPIC